MNTSPETSIGSPEDVEHLRLLTIFHYVMAGVTAVFSLFPIIHVVLGYLMVFHPLVLSKGERPPPTFIGVLFMVMGLIIILLGWTLAACTYLSGKFIRDRRRRIFSLMIGGLLCLAVPLGTILGVFTIIVLSRESVQRLYRLHEESS